MLEEAWLDRRYYGGDLPAAAEHALHAAARDWHDETAAEAHVAEALRLAPGHLAVGIGAYKFYLYRHRLAEALPHAEACLAAALRQNGLAADWRALRPEQAAFTTLEPGPRLVLFTLIARGYVLARLGREAEGRESLMKVAELDPADRLGGRRLIAVLDRGGRDDEEA